MIKKYRKTSENKKLNNKKTTTKNCNKSPVANNLLKYKKLNVRVNKNAGYL